MERITVDDRIPTLYVRTYDSGAQSYVCIFRANGNRITKTICEVGVLPLPQVRRIARDLTEEFIRSGLGISRKSLSFSEVAWEYIEKHSKPRKKSWKEDERILKKYLIPAFGGCEIGSVTLKNLEDLHVALSKSPYQANRVLALASVIFSKAVKWGYCHKNPCLGVSRNRECPRRVAVAAFEMPRLLEAIGQEPKKEKAALLLYLLTGARKSEILSLRWTDVDFAASRICFAETKSGKPRTLPVSAFAMSLLQELEVCGPYVFPSPSKAGHLMEIRKPWIRVRQKAKLNNLRLHDLRRTLASYLNEQGYGLATISKILGHSSPHVTAKHYLSEMGSMDTALKDFSALIEKHVN